MSADDGLASSLRWTDKLIACMAQPALSPPIQANGRIAMPGLPQGLPIGEYRRLASVYTAILDADQLLMSYRDELSMLDAETCPDGLSTLHRSQEQPHLFYKREDLTAIRAYKVRGAVNGMANAMEHHGFFRFLAVSTGNHALGVLKAAELLSPDSVRIFVPTNTAPAKLARLMQESQRLQMKGVQTQIIISGLTFDESKQLAMAENQAEYYIDPYADPHVVAGQGTVGLELFRQLLPILLPQEGSAPAGMADNPPLIAAYRELVLIAPVGGGGLLAGTATALRMASLSHPAFQSLRLRLMGLRLADINSALGDAIRVKYTADSNRHLFERLGVELATVTDPQMRQGMDLVWRDLGIAIEGACGGTLMPIMTRQVEPSPEQLVVCLLSGGNVASLTV